MWINPILQDMLRHIFQSCILESNEEILELIQKVCCMTHHSDHLISWVKLLKWLIIWSETIQTFLPFPHHKLHSFFCIWISVTYLRVSLCAGLDGATVSGTPPVCGCSQLSMDGRLALSHDAGLTHSHRPKHAVGSEGPLQGYTLNS